MKQRILKENKLIKNNNKMKVIGTVIKKLPIQKGITKSGKEWQKQDILIEQTDTEFDKELVITFFGDKMKSIRDFQEGQEVDISFNATSKEFNGRYYTNLNGWFCSAINLETIKTEENEEDLPF